MYEYPKWLAAFLGTSAQEIVDLFPGCITAGHERARNAQDASGLRQKNPYGGAAWLAVYEEFELQLGALPGASLFKPKNASFKLVVINDTLIYPCRVDVPLGGSLSDGRMKPTRLRRGISELPERIAFQEAFDFARLASEEGEEWWEPDAIIPNTVARRVLLVPFISNADAGPLAIAVGAGPLLEDGSVAWEAFHQLQLGLHSAGPQAVVEEPDEPRFDSGIIPDPFLSRRNREVKNPEAADQVSDGKLVRVQNDGDE